MYGNFLYGEIRYGDSIKDRPDIDKDVCDLDLMPYLPDYYQNSKITINIEDIASGEICGLIAVAKDVFEQFNVDTATWGLDMFEKELGIRVDRSKSYEDRREIIKARWRGRGTTTVSKIKEVAETFSGGEVDVIEHYEHYYFIIKFIGQKGIPKNLEAFKKQLNLIIPAHLGYKFEFVLMVWDMIEHLAINWDELEENQITWRQLQEYRVDEINEEDWEGII